MKNLLITLFAFAFILGSFAQKLNKESAGVILYEMPPVEKTIQAYSNYTTKHDAPASSLNSNLLTIINDNGGLPGFTKVGSDGAFDLIVSLSFSDNKFGSTSTVAGSPSGFVGTVSYSSVANIKLMKGDGAIIHEKSMIIKEDFKSTTQTTAPAATSAINTSKATLEQEYFKRATKRIYGHLINQYCYSEEAIMTSCFQIKGKDYDYSSFNAEFENIKLAIGKQTSGNYFSDEIKTLVTTALTFFLDVRTKYDAENKKAMYSNENIGGIDYNIAVCYFLLKDYDNALKYFLEAEKQGKLLTIMLPSFIESSKILVERKANLR
ncbi:MAG: tetratricopeptide repeat protein [Crocinitomicaceae bacterium]|nr:tetratricopeptide repeat protein [Crocinitomicaceae bacterium]MBK9590000.1 tetratricopeptide repeat protein [Crocinitomicaceae bacterium]